MVTNNVSGIILKKQSIRLLLWLGILVFSPGCTEEEKGIKPRIGNLTESVYASVTITPESLYKVYASGFGILEEVFIEEGDTVNLNQPLARISTTNADFRVETAELGVALSRENYLGQSNTLSSLMNELEQVQQQLSLDSINYFRQKNLWAQSIGSKVELENKKLKYEMAQKTLAGLKNNYQQTKIALENQYQTAQTNLRQAQADRNDYLIKSKLNGKVYSLLKNEGELISTQEPFAVIGKANEFLIEMLIDEVDIARVHLGQEAFISLDAYRGQVYEARITKIYPQKDVNRQTFKVEGKFVQPPDVLFAGLSGEANIVFAQRKNVISIPLEFLIDDQKVKTPTGERIVQTGVRTMDQVEIISGIDTATIILKP